MELSPEIISFLALYSDSFKMIQHNKPTNVINLAFDSLYINVSDNSNVL